MTAPLGTRRRRAVTAALLVGTFLASLEVMVVSPAMPRVVAEFGGAGHYPWVFTAFIAAQTVAMLVWGSMSDRRGRRDTYALGVATFVGASVAAALAPSMPALIAARAVQGFGAGALVPLTVTIFGDLYAVEDRTKMQGVFSIIWGVSALFGPAVGGLLTDLWSWRAIFWMNLPPGLVAAAVVLALLPRSLGAGGKRDRRWATPVLLRDRTQQVINGTGLFLGAGLIGIIGFLPVWVQAVLGGTTLDAGLAVIPFSVAWTAGANLAGRLVRRLGFRDLIRLGVASSAAGAIASALWTAHTAGLVLYGFGMGFVISAFNVAAQEAAPLDMRGSASSLSLLSRSIGSAVGIAIFGVVAGIDPRATSFAEVEGLEGGVARVFWAVAICMVIAGAGVAAWFPGKGRELGVRT